MPGALRARWTYVAVPAEMLEQLDLAQGALGEDLLAEDIGDLLDGDALVRLAVDGGAAMRENGSAKANETSDCE